MKRIKSILGILLIVLSIAGLFFWEWKGRETIFLEEVLVAKQEIQKGTIVNSSMFITKGVPKDNLLRGALTPKDTGLLQSKVAAQFIPENDQIISDYFRSNEFCLDEGESVFVIEPCWISMRSSSLRRGDIVDIYSSNGGDALGSYQIAFVKDSAEREVQDAGEGTIIKPKDDLLDRIDSTSVIDHIEIISTLSEYEKLAACVNGEMPSTLIIVQRGDRIDT